MGRYILWARSRTNDTCPWPIHETSDLDDMRRFILRTQHALVEEIYDRDDLRWHNIGEIVNQVTITEETNGIQR